MLIAQGKKQLRKHLRGVVAVAMVFCLATGLFTAPIFAESHTAASPAGSHATLRAASFTAPNDPDFSKQWMFKPFTFMGDPFPYTRIDKAWALMPSPAQKLRVAVLDEGFDVDHPDLAANINKQLAWNTHEENHDVSHEQGSKGHGTHVAGIFGAVAGNGIGIAGIAKNLAEIVPIKTAYTHSNGQFGVDLTETAKGIDYAVAHGCKIINMSNGTYYENGKRHAALDAAVANAVRQGVLLVAAAGNGNTSDLIFPSDHDDVISVTSATQTGEKASYSDFNAHKDIAAPGGGQKEGSSIGGEIYSTVPGGYSEKHGTSMAAPFVTGVLTLMLAANPNLTVDEAKDILYKTATDLGAHGRDDIFGHGLINAEAAVTKALEMKDSGNEGTSTDSGDNNGNNPGMGGGDNGADAGGGNSGNADTGTNSGNNGSNTGTGGGDNGGDASYGNGSDTGSNSNAGTGTSDNSNASNGSNNGADNSTDKDADTTSAKNPAYYKITFQVNGGKKLKAALMKKTVLFGKKYGKLPKPKRNNYKFLGWYTKKTGGIKITGKSIVKIQKNHKLYAHWRRK